MLVVFYIKLWLWNLKLIILLVKLILHRFLGKGKIQMDIAQVVLDKFSNNETTVRLGEPVRNQDIFIIQTGASSSPSPSSLKRCHRRGELQRCHRRASSSHQCLQACLCRVNHGCNLLIINTSIFSQCNWSNLFFPISVFPIWYSILLRLSPPTSHTPKETKSPLYAHQSPASWLQICSRGGPFITNIWFVTIRDKTWLWK